MEHDPLSVGARGLAAELVAWRRRLHRHPELGFEERRTAEFVAERLGALGLDVRTGIAETGVAAVLRAGNVDGPAVLLRADMDALPIQEVEGREYGSEIEGRMHACGHDGHVAMLLGAASLLAERRNELRREVVFCFQPGEEGHGGARRMIGEGVLDLAETGSVYALHLWSGFPSGTIQVRPGPTMAAQDEFTARVTGRGGHGAQPHLSRDPIVAAAHGVIALQTIVSRRVDPLAAAVVHVGAIHGGAAPNVMPEEVLLRGTLRSFDEDVRQLLRATVQSTLRGAVESTGSTLHFELHPGYPAVVNDPHAVEAVRRAAVSVVGAARVLEPPPLAAAEDFAYFLRERRGAFVFVGAGNARGGIDAPHHSSRFDIDESALPVGAELLARIALDPQA